MKILLAVLISMLVGCNSPRPVKQVTQPVQPTQTSTLEDQSQPRWATLEQQRMCSEQAEKQFRARGFTDKSSEYTSHYDARANVCFVMVHTVSATGTSVSDTELVFDAFERRGYASYVWVNAGKKKYWEVAPMTCVVYPRGQPEITCKSSDEFDALVDKYFGIAREVKGFGSAQK